MIEIYTDGSCLKNPDGPGGWAFCFIPENKGEENKVIIVSDGEKSTTNNRMELTAIIEALRFIGDEKDEKEYKIFTDSQLCINCATGVWKRNKNLDLWKLYDKYSKDKKLHFQWVKGHNGNTYNELVDHHAYQEAKKIEKI